MRFTRIFRLYVALPVQLYLLCPFVYTSFESRKAIRRIQKLDSPTKTAVAAWYACGRYIRTQDIFVKISRKSKSGRRVRDS